jgi:hypothetical protein
MANKKGSELVTKTAPVSADLICIIDTEAVADIDKNKKITIGSLPVVLSTTPADGIYSGPQFTGTAGENLVKGDVVYLKASDFKYYKADCSSITKLPAVAIATGTININNAGVFVKSGGYLGNSGWSWAASPIFVSTSGALTTTAPVTSGYYIQIFGYPTSATSIAVEPDKQMVQVA